MTKEKRRPDETEDTLKDMAVLNDEGLTFGIPSAFFFGGLVATLTFIVILRTAWYLGLIFGFVYFLAVYAMHEDNPKAARGWLRSLSRPLVWEASWHKKRHITFINNQE